MTLQNSDESIDHSESECILPPHPFFELVGGHASFVECMDALDRVSSMIELCGFLKLESGEELGLTPKAAFGYQSILVLTQGTLSYISDRLILLNKENGEGYKQESGYLSALISSLHTLDSKNREHLLNRTATHMNVTRSTVDQFVHKKAK